MAQEQAVLSASCNDTSISQGHRLVFTLLLPAEAPIYSDREAADDLTSATPIYTPALTEPHTVAVN